MPTKSNSSVFQRLSSLAQRSRGVRRPGVQTKPNTRRRQLRAELLEDRRLLAGDLQLVADLLPGSVGSGPYELTAVGDGVYFIANDGSGDAIWRHAPASGTTEKLQDPSNSQPLRGFDLREYQGTLVFGGATGSEGLYSYDADTGAVTQLSSIYSGEATVADGSIFFRADDGNVGEEVWRYDAGGSVSLVADLDSSPGSSYPTNLTYESGTLGFWSFFNVTAGTPWGETLYRLDVASGAITQEYTTASLSGQFPPANMAEDTLAIGGNLFFPAINEYSSVTEDRELGVNNDFININTIESDISPFSHLVDPSSFYTSSDVADLVQINGKLYFTATRTVPTFEGIDSNGDTVAVDSGGNPLDANIPGPVADFFPSGSFEFRGIVELNPTNNSFEFVVGNLNSELDSPSFDLAMNGGFMTPVGNKLLFVDHGSYGNGGLWTFDPDTRDVEQVASIGAPSQLEFSSENVAKLGSFVYLTANDPSTGRELYRLDINTSPVAVNDDVHVYTNTASHIAVLIDNGNGADSDDDGNTLLIDSVTQPAHGTVVINADQTVTYTPESEYSGADQFTYAITDGFGGTATATVNVNVQPAPPIANFDNFWADEDAGFVSTIGLLGNDFDPNDTPFHVSAINGISLSSLAGVEIATAVPDATLPVITTALNAENFYGFRFEVTEPTTISRVGGNFQFSSGSGPFAALIGLTGPNDFPDAEDLSTSDVIATTVIPLAFQQDGEASAELNAELQPGWYAVMYGTQKFGSTGVTNLFLNNAPQGSYSFIHSQPAVPSFVTPTPASRIPNARLFVTTSSDVVGEIELTLPSGAAITVNPSGDLAYDPRGVFNGLAAGQVASDGFNYEITNDTGQTAIANATIEVVGNNDVPTVFSQSLVVSEQSLANRTAANGMLKNATDPDGDQLTISQINGQPIVSGVSLTLDSGATLIPNEDGSFNYDPRTAFDGLTSGTTGSDSFLFTASDSKGGTATGLVEVAINGLNDSPVIGGSADPIEIFEGQTAILSGTVFDAEGSAVSMTASLGDVSVAPNGADWNWTFSTTDNRPPQTVTITATDGSGATSLLSFLLKVENRIPTVELVGDSSVRQLQTFTLDFANFVDLGDDSLNSATVSWGDGQSTTLSNLSAATHVYTAPPGTYTISLELVDEDGVYASVATTSVTVENVAPRITATSVDRSKVNEGDAVVLNVEIADGTEPHEVIVHWGDGTSTTTQLGPGVLTAAIPHTYADDHPTVTSIDVSEILIEVRDADSSVVTPSRLDVFESSFVGLQQFSGTGDVKIVDASYDAAGNYVVMGGFSQPSAAIPDGSGGWKALTTSGGQDWFVAHYSPTGLLNWTHRFGGTFDDVAKAITTDSQGNVIAVGQLNGTVDVDPGDGVQNVRNAHAVITLDKNGQFVQAFGIDVVINDVVVAANDEIVLGGRIVFEKDFDPGANEVLYAPLGGGDAFLARYAADGTFQWVRGFGSAAYDEITSLDISGNGRIVAAGQFSGTTDLDAGAAVESHTSIGAYDIFAVSYTADGTFQWGSHIGSTANDFAHSIAVSDEGAAYVATQVRGPIDIDPGTGTQTLATNGYDPLVWALTPEGSLNWGKLLRDSGNGRATGIAISPIDGNVVVTGTFDGRIDIGDQRITGASLDAFLAVLAPDAVAPDASVEYATSIGGTEFDEAAGIATSPLGMAAVFGLFGGTLSDREASVTLTSAGGYDGFLSTFSIAPATPYAPLITVSNLLPTIGGLSLAGDPNNASRIELTASVADPSSLDSMTAIVSWGDNTESVVALPAGTTTLAIAHQYIANDNTPVDGIYNISLRLLDDDGGEATTSESIAVFAEPEVTFEAGNLTVQEDIGAITLPIRLSVASSRELIIPIELTGTAADGQDYTVASASVTIPSGQIGGMFEITIVDDNIDELNPETIVARLGSASEFIVGRTPIQTVTILDNDTAVLSLISIDPTSNWEDVGTRELQANLSVARDVATRVPLLISGTATEGSDFTITSPNLSVGAGGVRYLEFPANVTQVPVTLNYLDDSDNEPANRARESIELALKATGLPIQTSDITVRHLIFDNDPIVYLGSKTAFSQVFRGDEGSQVSIPIYLSAPSNKTIRVPLAYQLYGSSFSRPRPGRDFFGPSGVEILPRTGGVYANVWLYQDNQDEATESFSMWLGTVSGGTASSSSGRLAEVIIDDDDTAKASISVQSAVREGDSFKVSVSLSDPSLNSSTIRIKLSGTARIDTIEETGGFAGLKVVANDFGVPLAVREANLNSGFLKVTIPAGSVLATFNVSVRSDAFAEGDETIKFSLHSATGGVQLGNGDSIRILANSAPAAIAKDVSKQGVTLYSGQLVIEPRPTAGTGDSAISGLFSQGAGNIDDGNFTGALNLPIANGAQGLLSGSTIFLDANFNRRQDYLDIDGNGVFSDGDLLEPALKTELDGSVTVDFSSDFDLDGDGFINQDEGQLVLVGGTDTSIDQSFDGVLTAPTGYFVISPLTTLLSQLIQVGAADSDIAEGRLFSALRLPDFDLSGTNHIWDAAEGSFASAEAYRADVSLATTVRLIAALFEPAGSRGVADLSIAVYRDLAEKLLAAGSVARFTDTSFVESMIRGVGFRLAIPINDSQVTAATQIAVGINEQIALVDNDVSRAYVDKLATLHKTAETRLVSAMQAIFSAADPHAIAGSNTGTELQAAVAATSVSNVLPPEMYVSDVAVIEGANGTAVAQVTVALVGKTDVPVSVSFGTADGTATADNNDYVPLAGTLTWQPGDAPNKTFDVLINGDATLESDETFTVQFFDADGIVMRHEYSQIYVINDDAVEFSVADATGPVALRMVVDDDNVEIYRDDVLVFDGEYAGGVPIAVVGASNYGTSLEIEIVNDGAILAGGVQFIGGATSDDSLVVSNSALSSTTFSRLSSVDGHFELPNGSITFSGAESVSDALTAEISYAGTLLEGGAVSLAAANDAFPLQPEDVVLWTVSRGDDVVLSSHAAAESFLPDDEGQYTVRLSVNRDGSGVGTTTASFIVGNVAPDFDAGIDVSLPSASAGTFSRVISFTDPGADAWSGTVDFGDGSGLQALVVDQASKTFSLEHVYATDGAYVVNVILNDDDTGTSSDSLAVTVNLNEPPIAKDDLASVTEDSPATINVLADNGDGPDSDPNNDPLTVISTTEPAHGGVVINNDGTVTYTPTENYFGRDAFEYTIADQAGLTSIATVFVTVNAVNDAPFIADPIVDAQAEEDAMDSVLNLANVFSDVDSSELFLSAFSSDETLVAVSIEGTTLTLQYGRDQSGSAIVTVQATDGERTVTDEFLVSVTPVNDAPESENGTAQASEDGAVVSGQLNASDVDSADDANTLTYALAGSPSEGTVTVHPNGSFSFDPGADFQDLAAGQARSVEFTFTATDRHGASSDAATVVITVTGVNDAPEVVTSMSNLVVQQGADDAIVDLTSLFTDIDGAFTMTATSSDGSLVTAIMDGAALLLTFPPSQSGRATLTVTADDGNSGVVSTSFDVTVNNASPNFDSVSSSASALVDASEDGAVSVYGAFLDLGTDTHTVSIDWGDGSATESISVDQVEDLFSGQHEYAHGGIFAIRLTVTDSNGAVAEAATQAVVEGVGLIGSTLYVIGTDQDDDVKIEIDEKHQKVEVETKLSGKKHAKKLKIVYDATDIDQVAAYLFEGDDKYEIKQKSSKHDSPIVIPQRVLGGEGDDRIEAKRDYSGSLEIYGGAGNDRIEGGGADDLLYGGEGEDRINGGPGSDIIFGGEGDDRLVGGYEGRWEEGNDIIIGGDGEDRIEGGSGSDLLIGGLGADDIRGNRGGDLLIGGFTTYDQSVEALMRVRAEWTSQRQYEDRINNLRTGSGPILAGNTIHLQASGADATVFDDEEQDRLSDGSGNDWYFAQLAGKREGDRVSKSRFELLDLLDDLN